jgi:HAD superfamily hydrolase (TIGR01484 family)
MLARLLLFDVDGTIAESGKVMDNRIKVFLQELQQKKKVKLGIVGGGTFSKICEQLDDLVVDYIFSECGSTYHYWEDNEYRLESMKILREHELYVKCKELTRHVLQFIGKNVETISGKFVDVRNGLIYISLVGMQADEKERKEFLKEENEKQLRKQLLMELREMLVRNAWDNELHVTIGGSTGIAIYPKEWDKSQILKKLNLGEFEQIYYFGDRYETDGNDFPIIFHEGIDGIPVDSIDETFRFLKFLFGKSF